MNRFVNRLRAAAGERRRIAAALAASALAHLLLLWPSQTAVVRPRLAASLRAAPATSAVADPLRVPTAPAMAAPPAVQRAARRADAPVKSPVPATSQPAAMREAAVPAADAQTAEDPPDADGLRSYRLAVALNARRFRHYPEPAVSRGESGVVGLRVAVSQGFPFGRVELLRSSGHAELDGEAQAMLTRAVHATDLPESLRGRAFSFEMPVEFALPAERP